MKLEKIAYSCFDDDEPISDSAIENAFGVKSLPVYVVNRHGRYYKRFSRDSAINKLAHIMTQKVFNRAGHQTNYPTQTIIGEDNEVRWKIGELFPEYIRCHKRAVRRIKLLLRRQKEIDILFDKYRHAFAETMKLKKECLNAIAKNSPATSWLRS
ncbi:hypothetical protein [Photorhabdus sp. SF281]|uniref:hypothetical protein n=1 Tax=Photorhabdus sp. SF281 TaxID=3459527 RepID=UPI0040449838